MGSKLVVTVFKDEPRWCLDGRPPSGMVFRTRAGTEVVGVVECDGDTPPGVPFFVVTTSDGQQTRSAVDTETDTFRLPSAEEQQRTHHVQRTLS